MDIVVAGWYCSHDFYDLLKIAKKEYGFGVIVISHKEGGDYRGLPAIEIPNVGLEFGCYDYYIKNLWKGENALFIHDDMAIEDIKVFKKISNLSHDAAYIFRDHAEEKANGGKHGRAIYCSSRFIKFVKNYTCDCSWSKRKEDKHHNPGTLLPELPPHTGFWFDPNNKGHISGKPPVGVRHYNDGIYHFHWFLGRMRDQRCGDQRCWPCPEVKMDVVNRVFFSDLIAARRNCWNHVEKERQAYGRKRA